MMKALPHNLGGKSFLPEHYQPSPIDVICARGTKSFYHRGNTSFRKSIADNLAMYGASIDKRDKSIIVTSIANDFYYNQKEHERCRFIRFCDSRSLWYEIPYDQVRQKVGQTIRDTLLQQDPQRLSRKKHSRARRASTRRCISAKANSRLTQGVATTATQPEEHVACSVGNGHAFCDTIPLSIQVTSTSQDTQGDVWIPSEQQLWSEMSWANLEWVTPSRECAMQRTNGSFAIANCKLDASDSDATSVSSCHWFEECDGRTLSSIDWMDDDLEKFWI